MEKVWIIANCRLVAEAILNYKRDGGFIIKKQMYTNVDEEELAIALEKLPEIQNVAIVDEGIRIYC